MAYGMTSIYFISRMPRERKKFAPDRSGKVRVSPENISYLFGLRGTSSSRSLKSL